MHLCVGSINFTPFYDISIDFETVPTAWYFFIFILLHYLQKQSYYVNNITLKKTVFLYNIFTYNYKQYNITADWALKLQNVIP